MKTTIDCLPCMIRQTIESCRQASAGEEVTERLLRHVMQWSAGLSFNQSPPQIARQIQAMVREATGNPDPYQAVKTEFNAKALALLPELEETVRQSADPFATALRIAIAGNIIDFGIAGHNIHDLMGTIERVLTTPLAIDHIDRLREVCSTPRKILYLGDNTGEIVFDRLLIGLLIAPDAGHQVTYAVKARPVLNDSTMADAEAVGMTGLVEVIDNGSDAPGTILELCSSEFLERFHTADLVISKGQGNFETLDETPRADIFYLLMAKCPRVAELLQCKVGDIIAMEGSSHNASASPAQSLAS